MRPNGGGGEDTWYYHYDGQLSTRQLTDDAESPAEVAVTTTHSYDAFGRDLDHPGLPSGTGTPPSENSYRYTGEQHDAATGFYYLRARYYDPALGRFSGRDPASGWYNVPITLHRYLYAHADPVNAVDPSGLFTIRSMAITLAVAALLVTIIIAGPFWSAASGDRGVNRNPSTTLRIGIAYSLRFGERWTYALLSGVHLVDLANDLRRGGHPVTLLQAPDETGLINLLNSNDIVLVVAHAPGELREDYSDKKGRPFAAIALGGVSTHPDDDLTGSLSPIDYGTAAASYITANEIEGRVNNPGLEFVGAACRLGRTNRMYHALGPGVDFVGGKNDVNAQDTAEMIQYVIDRANGVPKAAAQATFTNKARNYVVYP